jgi:hypothetical protein
MAAVARTPETEAGLSGKYLVMGDPMPNDPCYGLTPFSFLPACGCNRICRYKRGAGLSISINLAPADLKKEGPSFGLPMTIDMRANGWLSEHISEAI